MDEVEEFKGALRVYLGTDVPPSKSLSSAQRFIEKVDFSGPCWTWTTPSSAGGYGQFWHKVRSYPAHRLAFAATYGDGALKRVGTSYHGTVVDHYECGNPPCVRPSHLRATTQWANVNRHGTGVPQVYRGRTKPYIVCERGHLMEGKNRRNTPEGSECVACERARMEADKALRRRGEEWDVDRLYQESNSQYQRIILEEIPCED